MPKFLFCLRGFLLIFVLSLCSGQFLTGQQPAQDASGSQQSRDGQKPSETLKVNVNVGQLFFNVKDKHGALIPNLKKEEFDISEENTPQTIKYFTAESNLPLTLGMMIDSSG